MNTSENSENIAALKALIDSSKKIVFFGGAGVSTESGIPDFRSVDGLYHQQWDFPPETILSHDFFYANTKEFYRFYHEKLLPRGIQPNKAHIALAKLEARGVLSAIVTQNIDGLHQSAGSKNVFELHGSVMRNTCTKCGAHYGLEPITQSELAPDKIPLCAKDGCGGLIKPDVVLYGEGLDNDVVDGAISAIAASDLLIIGGTSLTVYPAAGLINYFRGEKIVIINKAEIDAANHITLVIREPIGEVLSQCA
ncbi:MAG: NAD-dependent protein deacylase [Treponemataceae bacterium]|nr:MAG: NAD-dependent protein deacylase [Treponemataceae bacterium]